MRRKKRSGDPIESVLFVLRGWSDVDITAAPIERQRIFAQQIVSVAQLDQSKRLLPSRLRVRVAPGTSLTALPDAGAPRGEGER